MSMRLRFILGHVLPLLIVVPLVGILLIVSFERRVILPNVRSEVEDDLDLLRNLIATSPRFWSDPVVGQGFVDSFYREQDCCLRLLDAGGNLVTSNNPADRARYGLAVEDPAVQLALAGEEVIQMRYSQRLEGDVIEGVTPVYGIDGALIGVIQITHPLASLVQDVMRVRGMVMWILGGGLAIGVILGLVLSAGLERPIRRLTRAVDRMRTGEDVGAVELSGPSELRRLAASFNELMRDLKQEKATREQLIANLVHELGRPLGAMRSAVFALSKGADQDPELEASLLSGIDAHTRELERLVDDLMHLHEYSSGKFEIHRRRIKLGTWLASSLTPWRSLADKRGIDWDQEIHELPAAWIDPDRMTQVVGNLLSNALKFTPKGGNVKVIARQEPGAVIIMVEDSGAGLSQADMDHMFSRFYVGRSTLRFPQGMGLGLSIARDLVEAHDGAIEARALPGQGSQFTIRLPLPRNEIP